MVARKSNLKMAQNEAIKIARTALRLKYSILAEREMNELLPEIHERVALAFNEGRPFDADIEELFALPEGS